MAKPAVKSPFPVAAFAKIKISLVFISFIASSLWQSRAQDHNSLWFVSFWQPESTAQLIQIDRREPAPSNKIHIRSVIVHRGMPPMLYRFTVDCTKREVVQIPGQMVLDDNWKNPKSSPPNKWGQLGLDKPLAAMDLCRSAPLEQVEFAAANVAWRAFAIKPPARGQSLAEIAQASEVQTFKRPPMGVTPASWTTRPADCDPRYCAYSTEFDWIRPLSGLLALKRFGWENGLIVVADARCGRCRQTAQIMATSLKAGDPRLTVGLLEIGPKTGSGKPGGVDYLNLSFDDPVSQEMISLGIGYEPCVIVVRDSVVLSATCTRTANNINQRVLAVARRGIDAFEKPLAGSTGNVGLGGLLMSYDGGQLPASPSAAPVRLTADPHLAQMLLKTYRPEGENRLNLAVAGGQLRLSGLTNAGSFEAQDCWSAIRDPDLCWPFGQIVGHTHPQGAKFFSDGDLLNVARSWQPGILVTEDTIYLALTTLQSQRVAQPSLEASARWGLRMTCNLQRENPSAPFSDAYVMYSRMLADYLGLAIYKWDGTGFTSLPQPPRPLLSYLKDGDRRDAEVATDAVLTAFADAQRHHPDRATAAKIIRAVENRRQIVGSKPASQTGGLAKARYYVDRFDLANSEESVVIGVQEGCSYLYFMGSVGPKLTPFQVSYPLDANMNIVGPPLYWENHKRMPPP